MSDDSALPPRSRRKRRAILDAALPAFLAAGYAQANLDAVAAAAGASKVTIYHHFGSKEGLFVALIEEQVGIAERQSDTWLDALRDTHDVEADLHAFAREFVSTVMQPSLVAMRRLLIGAATQFPQLADSWFKSGPDKGYQTLGDLFRRLDEQGHLRIPDPAVAARAFTWLVLGAPLTEAMFRPDAGRYDADLLARRAEEGTDVFLAAYRPPAHGSAEPASHGPADPLTGSAPCPARSVREDVDPGGNAFGLLKEARRP